MVLLFLYLFQIVRSLAVGIDLGTTFSVVAAYKDGEVEVIPNELDKKTTPSIVSFYNGTRVVGDSANRMITIDPENTIFSVKRLIGRRFSDESVQKEISRVPFHIVERDNHPYIKISTQDDDFLVSPEEISGLVLGKLKHIAERYLHKTVTDAVITVPAYFNEEQRKATMTAGLIAGLKVSRIISEPTAAALAYGLDKKGDRYVIVYDLGGGTFDVSLLSMESDYFEVIATGGDTRLGGEDFDEKCVSEMISRFYNKNQRDASRDRVALARLKKYCEKAKIELSQKNISEIEIDDFYDGYSLHENLTKAQFDSLNHDYFQKTIETIQKVLDDAQINSSMIDDIVMIGGSSRIPKVREMVSEFFGGKKLCTDINPDEAVAYGAAVQASVINQENSGLVVVDVYPLTLGVETVGGLMSPIIPRNTRIPVKRSKLYTTHRDDASGARIEIFEGERPLTRDNRVLGVFELHGLPRARRGELQIEVVFEIDANAILTVTASELSSKQTQSIEIDTIDYVLSQSQIDEAIESASLFEDEDKIDRDRVIARINKKRYESRKRKSFVSKIFI